jgi:ferredoxin
MATMITAECINCGACEPECPNTAIYQGGVEYELNGVMHPPLSNDVFYIVPEKCTECVGFHDQEACAAVCPVDVCIPNPDIPEGEEVLLQRAKQLHPDKTFPANFPSRFNPGRAEGGAAAAPATAAPAAPAAAPAAAAPAAVKAPAAAAGPVEKPLAAPQRKPRVEKSLRGELSISFEEAEAKIHEGWVGKPSWSKLLIALAQPLLGALPASQKRALEQAVEDRRYFSAAGATGLNALHNIILYPVVLLAVGAVVGGKSLFSADLKWWLFLGVVLGSVEAALRLRESFSGKPADQVIYRGAAYGLALAPLASPLVSAYSRPLGQADVGHDGFTDARFEERLERQRRYGEVYDVSQDANGYLVELQFPRRVPPSGIKEELGVADEMPDYDYDIALQGGHLVVRGKVTDPTIRKIAAVSPAFPPDFTTTIELPTKVAGFRHRFQGKNLQIALPRKL